MRFLSLFVALLLFTASIAKGAPANADATLVAGLQTCVSNGIDSGIRAWYVDRPDLGAEMSNRVAIESAKLGAVIDSEVVASQPISKRVTRYYVALYFSRGPLWIRIDRYENREKVSFLPLKCSVNPDEIMPGYITEFYR